MRILAIETSCDETALALLSVNRKKVTVESHSIASQIALHTQYGGVFPMMAKREHAKNIVPLFLQTLSKAGLKKPSSKRWDEKMIKKLEKLLEREPEMLVLFLEEIPKIKKPKIDKIVVTVGPGLAPALWVGINFAKALSYVWDIPLAPVNHMEGHVLSIFPQKNTKEFEISKLPIPLISLLVSGGHTELVLVKDTGKYTVLGQTRDDAAGEAFDKVARMLALPYPGGPHISAYAARARENNNPALVTLPRPMLHTKDFDFSFSGLKTAVLYFLKDKNANTEKSRGTNKNTDEENKMIAITEEEKESIALEFENAVVDVLVTKTMAAAEKYTAHAILVGGGVAANAELRKRLTAEGKKRGFSVIFPNKELSTDNAVMIGIAGIHAKTVPLSSKKLLAQGNLAL